MVPFIQYDSTGRSSVILISTGNYIAATFRAADRETKSNLSGAGKTISRDWKHALLERALLKLCLMSWRVIARFSYTPSHKLLGLKVIGILP